MSGRIAAMVIFASSLAATSAQATTITAAIDSSVTGAYIVGSDGSKTDILANLGAYLEHDEIALRLSRSHVAPWSTGARRRVDYVNLSGETLLIETTFALEQTIEDSLPRYEVFGVYRFNYWIPKRNEGKGELLDTSRYRIWDDAFSGTYRSTYLLKPETYVGVSVGARLFLRETPLPASVALFAPALAALAGMAGWRARHRGPKAA